MTQVDQPEPPFIKVARKFAYPQDLKTSDPAKAQKVKCKQAAENTYNNASDYVAVSDKVTGIVRGGLKITNFTDRVFHVPTGGFVAAPIGIVDGILTTVGGGKTVHLALTKKKLDASEGVFGIIDIATGIATVGVNTCWLVADAADLAGKVTEVTQVMGGPIVDYAFAGLSVITCAVSAARWGQINSFRRELNQLKKNQTKDTIRDFFEKTVLAGHNGHQLITAFLKDTGYTRDQLIQFLQGHKLPKNISNFTDFELANALVAYIENIATDTQTNELDEQTFLQAFNSQFPKATHAKEILNQVKNFKNNIAKAYRRRFERLAKVAGKDCAELLAQWMHWGSQMVKEMEDVGIILPGSEGLSDLQKAEIYARQFSDDSIVQSHYQHLLKHFDSEEAKSIMDNFISLARQKDTTFKDVEQKLIEKAEKGSKVVRTDQIIKFVFAFLMLLIAILLIALNPAVGSTLWIALTVTGLGLGIINLIINIARGKYAFLKSSVKSCMSTLDSLSSLALGGPKKKKKPALKQHLSQPNQPQIIDDAQPTYPISHQAQDDSPNPSEDDPPILPQQSTNDDSDVASPLKDGEQVAENNNQEEQEVVYHYNPNWQPEQDNAQNANTVVPQDNQNTHGEPIEDDAQSNYPISHQMQDQEDSPNPSEDDPPILLQQSTNDDSDVASPLKDGEQVAENNNQEEQEVVYHYDPNWQPEQGNAQNADAVVSQDNQNTHVGPLVEEVD